MSLARHCAAVYVLRNHSLGSTPHDQCHCYFVWPVCGLSLRVRVPAVPTVRGRACSGGHQQPDQVRLVQIDALRDHALPRTAHRTAHAFHSAAVYLLTTVALPAVTLLRRAVAPKAEAQRRRTSGRNAIRRQAAAALAIGTVSARKASAAVLAWYGEHRAH